MPQRLHDSVRARISFSRIAFLSSAALAIVTAFLLVELTTGTDSAQFDDATRLGQPRETFSNPSFTHAAFVRADKIDDEVSFSRDIKPLLSDRCFLCHGPDESSRLGGFRLDDPESAFGESENGEIPIVPGDPDASELIRRISLDPDDDERMPPEEAHKPSLTEAEVQKFRTWIEQGAKYEKHWAFVAPQRPQAPVTDSDWGNGPIDAFVLAQMTAHGLAPSAPAERAKMIRRLTFDLTGLPPTIAEVEAFIADDSPDAYERVVDRLLGSPRYGEHMARFWLDIVRYADTHGLHFDNYREVWPYRDWVIAAYNANMSWDEFTTRQIAGDLLPDPTDEDLIASGYNRLHVTTNEGGSIKEEVYVRNVVDRVSTTGSVFLGLSVGCAQCHDHKFDPITAKDFYSLFAFFNNLDAEPMDGNDKAHAPVIRIPTPETSARITELESTLAALKTNLEKPDAEFEAAWKQWQSDWHERSLGMWSPLEIIEAGSDHETTFVVNDNQNVVTATEGDAEQETYEITLLTELTGITALRLEALAGVNESAGRAANGNAVLSEFEAEICPADNSADFTPLRFVSADADHEQPTFPIIQAIDGIIDADTGWAIEGHGSNKGSRTASFATDSAFGFEGGTLIRVRLRFDSKFSLHSFKSVRLAATQEPDIGSHRTGPWNLLGPFVSEDGKAAFEKDFGPENEIDLAAVYNPNGGLASAETKTDESAPVNKDVIADEAVEQNENVNGNEDPGNNVSIDVEKADAAETPADVSWQLNAEFADGTPHIFPGSDIGVIYLYREILSPGERELTLSLGSDDGIRVFLNGELVHENDVARGVAPDQDVITIPLRSGSNELLLKIVNIGGATAFYYAEKESQSLMPGMAMQTILQLPEAERTEAQQTELRNFFLRTSPLYNGLLAEIDATIAEITAVEETQPTTLVMKERMEPKPAFLLMRGEYDQPDKERGPIERAVPSFLPPLPENAPNNRLGFAQWLLADENPLMARVTVNRFWQQFMGTGIVATPDDFGSQGALPTHGELLDWLAVEFRESGWNVKAIVKQIVMSETYQQDSKITKEAFAADPKNNWLARGPRYRLDAEMLRDQALAVSGLLVNKIGGPGVKPPQPDGLWKAVGYVGANTSVFKADEGPEKVHRRSIYTFWKRTSPPPEMTVFDSPTREECVISRERTNNPLQALLLLNDPQYFEAARHLAQRVVSDQVLTTSKERAERVFYLATLREPSPGETAVLIESFELQLSVFRNDEKAATQVLTVGAFAVPESADIPELAAWTVIGNIVLNLDEVITKQ